MLLEIQEKRIQIFGVLGICNFVFIDLTTQIAGKLNIV